MWAFTTYAVSSLNNITLVFSIHFFFWNLPFFYWCFSGSCQCTLNFPRYSFSEILRSTFIYTVILFFPLQNLISQLSLIASYFETSNITKQIISFPAEKVSYNSYGSQSIQHSLGSDWMAFNKSLLTSLSVTAWERLHATVWKPLFGCVRGFKNNPIS